METRRVDPVFVYPPGWGFYSLSHQLLICNKLFPSLKEGTAFQQINEAVKAPLGGMEGYVLTPKLRVIAELAVAQGVNTSWPRFNQALWLIDNMMEQVFGWKYFLAYERFTSDYVKLAERTEEAHDILDHRRPGDFLVLPVQFGERYAGVCPRDAPKLFAPNEFALDPCSIALFLMIHSQMIPRWGSVLMDAPGAMYSHKHDGNFNDVSQVRVQDSFITFGEWDSGERCRPNQGTVSAFAPAPF